MPSTEHPDAAWPPPDAPQVDDQYVQVIVDEAHARGIEVEVLDERWGALRMHLEGRSVSMRSSLSELTSALAMARCQDKVVTRRVLERRGVEVPRGRVADGSDEDTVFLDEVGTLVVKPAVGEAGAGVTVGVREPDDLRAAVADARELWPEVLLEACVDGDDVRVVVIDGEVVAAAARRPATVEGDGTSTLRELATAALGDVDEDDLRRQAARADLAADDVVAQGRTVRVVGPANVHQGGAMVDVTDRLHPGLAAAARDTAEALEMPLVGVDMMVPDLDDDAYVVIEANERPGLANHEPHPTVARYLDLLFPGSGPAAAP